MVRQRRSSAASDDSGHTARDQELGSMYDYLAKIVLLGPSGSGKSCLLHRFIKNEWRSLSSQTIGVEFASKIIRIGTGSRMKRIKLQLWDTAGTERFRSVSRSYYRGAAGAILVYDITSAATFAALPPFLADARALASPRLTTLLVGNKGDLAGGGGGESLLDSAIPLAPSSASARSERSGWSERSERSETLGGGSGSVRGLGARLQASEAPEGREVGGEEASRWASKSEIPVAVEVSALSGEGVDEVFHRLARMILTKIELGEIDPDDPLSGIQYGDMGGGWEDGASIKSGAGGERRRGGLREWEDVFTLSGRARRRGRCC